MDLVQGIRPASALAPQGPVSPLAAGTEGAPLVGPPSNAGPFVRLDFAWEAPVLAAFNRELRPLRGRTQVTWRHIYRQHPRGSFGSLAVVEPGRVLAQIAGVARLVRWRGKMLRIANLVDVFGTQHQSLDPFDVSSSGLQQHFEAHCAGLAAHRARMLVLPLAPESDPAELGLTGFDWAYQEVLLRWSLGARQTDGALESATKAPNRISPFPAQHAYSVEEQVAQGADIARGLLTQSLEWPEQSPRWTVPEGGAQFVPDPPEWDWRYTVPGGPRRFVAVVRHRGIWVGLVSVRRIGNALRVCEWGLPAEHMGAWGPIMHWLFERAKAERCDRLELACAPESGLLARAQASGARVAGGGLRWWVRGFGQSQDALSLARSLDLPASGFGDWA